MRRVLLLCLVLVVLSPALLANAQSEEDDDTIRVWIGWEVPDAFTDMLDPLFATDAYERVNNRDEAHLEVVLTESGGTITSQWVYVPVVPFASVAERVRAIDIQRYWAGDGTALNYLTLDNTPATLVVTRDVLDTLEFLFGEPAPTTPIQVVPGDAVMAQLWEQRPNAWTMLAFDDLTSYFKALNVDDMNIFSEDFDLQDYPYSVQIGMHGDEWATGQAIEDLLSAGTWRGTNRDSAHLTRIVLSGVTALTRATAYAMETNGITTPGEGILPFVADADLLHTSNEVPFSVQCPPPDPYAGTIFCADDSYLELLTHIGLDVAELTGNHINDYGPGALRHTLELYDEAGIAYFGGGHTPEEARAAWITEHNGNTIAFIGCNVPGPFKAWVSDERPGAAPCDDTFLEQELARLADEVDIVIMTVQEFEYYRYDPPQTQLRRFTSYANWGADVVIGSQAHQPQGFTFIPRDDLPPSFLHHGLGNLFFDQMADIGTRQMFMDRLIIYNGNVVGVELYTGLIEDFCCPRPMTPVERIDFLQTIFTASGWQ